MAQGDALRTYNYRMVHNQWDRNKPLDIKIDSLTAENRAALCKLFPIADEQLLMGENIMSYARSISNPLIDWPEEAKLKGTFAEDLQRVLPLVQKAANISLTETDRKILESVHNPFYRDAILKMLENAQIALKEVEGKAIIEKTPEVTPDKLFEALIAPYKGLDARIFRQVAKDLRCRIKFMDLAFDEAIEAAKRLSPDTCDVVLSRGVTVDVVKQNSSIPVVPIDFSAWDLLQALQPYAGHVRNVAFFRYSTPLPGLSSVEKALGMRIKEHLYGSKNEMHLRLIQLDPADVELFVARGTLVCQWATAAGFPTLEIIDGEISAKRTLLEAVNVARARRSERQRTARFGAILDAIDEGIVVYDAQGKVNLITPSAESLLNCAKKEALGEHIRTVMPGVFSPGTLAGDKAEHGRVHDIRGTTLVINRVPILFQGQNVGTVCSISDARRIYKAEAKLRNKLKSKGFTTRYSFGDIRTRSPHVRHLKELGVLYASTDANLLICGESGTGKELFAQSIHAASLRKDKPFVAVNLCRHPRRAAGKRTFRL